MARGKKKDPATRAAEQGHDSDEQRGATADDAHDEILGTLAAGAAARAQKREHTEWKPKLGILGPYSEANLAFAHETGFTNMILGATPTLMSWRKMLNRDSSC